MEKCETCGQLINKYDEWNADIDISYMKWVDKKVEFTLDRLSRVRKWQCGTKWEYLKQQCINKLKDQFEFLLRVQAIKEEDKEKQRREREEQKQKELEDAVA